MRLGVLLCTCGEPDGPAAQALMHEFGLAASTTTSAMIEDETGLFSEFLPRREDVPVSSTDCSDLPLLQIVITHLC